MKIAIVGVGSVGETCAHALVASDVATELVLLNRTVETVVAIERDLRQARAWRGNLATESGPANQIEAVLGCDLVVLTFGPRLEGSQDRSAVAKKSAAGLMESGILGELKRLAPQLPPILVVTNPVEPIVTWLWARTGIMPNKLFGLGTTVDAARLSMHIGNRVGVSARSAWTNLVGEHGDGILIAGHGRLAGILRDADLDGIEQRSLFHTKRDALAIRALTESVAKRRAAQLVEKLEKILGQSFQESKREAILDRIARDVAPPATRFAIAAAVTEVARAIYADEHRLMTVSSQPPPDWKLPRVALALPFQIGGGTLGECLLASPPNGLAAIAAKIEQIVSSLPS